MDLSTTYLGLDLPHPLMTGASPLVDRLDLVRRLEDAGTAAITMHSLFEEQILLERQARYSHFDAHAEGFAEALSFFPNPDDYNLGPEEYLEQIRRIKAMVDVPVIGSLNGATGTGWVEYAQLIQHAGADALELNIYYLATDPTESGAIIDERVVGIASMVKQAVSIPVAVKLSPFFSSVANVAAQLDSAGIDGLVLFNRFYQPDIDVETLDVPPRLQPKMDGYAFIQKLRINPETRSIPVVFLSATYVTPEDKRFALSLGAARFMEKPIDTEDFLLTVAELVTQQPFTQPQPLDMERYYKGIARAWRINCATRIRRSRVLNACSLPSHLTRNLRLRHCFNSRCATGMRYRTNSTISIKPSKN